MNESKFNSKNRIFLSCTAGNLRTASGKCRKENTGFCSCFTSETCHSPERRGSLWLLLGGFKRFLSFLPKVDPTFPGRANQRKQEGISFGLGQTAKLRTGKKKPEKHTILDSRGTTSALPSCLSPVCIFVASQFRFTGSPGNECQAGRCNWVKNSEKRNALGSLFQPRRQLRSLPKPTGTHCAAPAELGQPERVMSQCLLIKMPRKGAASCHSSEEDPTETPTRN